MIVIFNVRLLIVRSSQNLFSFYFISKLLRHIKAFSRFIEHNTVYFCDELGM